MLVEEAALAIREADLHRRSGRVADLIGRLTLEGLAPGEWRALGTDAIARAFDPPL